MIALVATEQKPTVPMTETDVQQALAKWPNVPSCFGWLRLDRRGDWWVQDERITHSGLLAFIARHYAHDASGRYFFQNGPQRVYVDLEYTPWVYRVHGADLYTHTGCTVTQLRAALLDEEGALVLWTEQGLGALDDRDLLGWLPHVHGNRQAPLTEPLLQQALAGEQTLYVSWSGVTVPVVRMHSAEMPLQGAFVRKPVPPPEAVAGQA